jgi:hypothetical protein
MRQKVTVVLGYTGEIDKKVQEAVCDLNNDGWKVMQANSSIGPGELPRVAVILIAEQQ